LNYSFLVFPYELRFRILLRPTVPIKDGIAVKMGFAPLFNGICALCAGRLRKNSMLILHCLESAIKYG